MVALHYFGISQIKESIFIQIEHLKPNQIDNEQHLHR
jgi:hypothetical protein